MSEVALARAIEESLFVLPEIPGLVRHLYLPDLRGRVAPLPDPVSNRVGLANLADLDAGSVVDEVRRTFTAEGKAFDWVVGPTTRPPDLGSRLERAGFRKKYETAGMVLEDLGRPIPIPGEIVVRVAAEPDLSDVAEVFAEGFGWSPELSKWFVSANWRARERLWSQLYVAYEPGSGEAMAVASLVLLPGQRLAALSAAATLPKPRGRGAYRSLVARRIADAHALGAEVALISALHSTSAPIARELGFREVCTLEFYLSTPGR